MAAAGGAGYWLLEYGNSAAGTLESYSAKTSVDSSGNLIAGTTVSALGSGDNEAVISSIAPDGSFNWSKMLSVSGDDRGRSTFVDGSDNCYIVGQFYVPDAYSHREYIAKFNNSGTVTWKKFAGGPSGDTYDSPTGYDIAVDTSGNIYTVGKQDYTGYADLYISKYNSSGTLQWSRSLNKGTNLSSQVWCVACDNVNAIYSGGYEEKVYSNYSLGTMRKTLVATGVGNWEKVFALAPSGYQSTHTYGNSCDGTDVYFCGRAYDDPGEANKGFVNSLACSDGSENWLTTCTTSSGYPLLRSTHVGSDDYLYVVGENTSDSSSVFFRLDISTGVVDWQLKIKHATANISYSKGIAYDSTTDSIYVTGYTNASGNWNPYAMRLPADGSLTGTFGDWTVSNPSMTFAYPSGTYYSVGYSDPTWTPTTGNSTQTISTPTYTLENLSAF